MKLLDNWLSELLPSQRILDLGCGCGSLTSQLAERNVIGVDIDAKELARNPALSGVCAESHRLPFRSNTFDMVVCHHSLEHLHELTATIREIRRVLKPEGRLFVSVPDGRSFSDRLYRVLLCGGGHVQQFCFETVVHAIESGTGLHLAGSTELFTSFIFVNKSNFLPAPLGRLPGPLPRRMRWLGHLPNCCFDTIRLWLNVATRMTDSVLNTGLSRYGWALAFAPTMRTSPLVSEQGYRNVCMSCGAGLDRRSVNRLFRLLYRCPRCSQVNFLFSENRQR